MPLDTTLRAPLGAARAPAERAWRAGIARSSGAGPEPLVVQLVHHVRRRDADAPDPAPSPDSGCSGCSGSRRVSRLATALVDRWATPRPAGAAHGAGDLRRGTRRRAARPPVATCARPPS